MYRNCTEHPAIAAVLLYGEPEPRIERGVCECGDTVYADEDFVYLDGKIMHDECAMEAMRNEFGDLTLKEMAKVLGKSVAW